MNLPFFLYIFFYPILKLFLQFNIVYSFVFFLLFLILYKFCSFNYIYCFLRFFCHFPISYITAFLYVFCILTIFTTKFSTKYCVIMSFIIYVSSKIIKSTLLYSWSYLHPSAFLYDIQCLLLYKLTLQLFSNSFYVATLNFAFISLKYFLSSICFWTTLLL